ncbi:MAG: hypothetical protein JSR58_03445 [Verrucomicrobia bacterium]|nr:hypothetical protein [Verrucomicrobiota bacterium]
MDLPHPFEIILDSFETACEEFEYNPSALSAGALLQYFQSEGQLRRLTYFVATSHLEEFLELYHSTIQALELWLHNPAKTALPVTVYLVPLKNLFLRLA